jgi:hypothetical protein
VKLQVTLNPDLRRVLAPGDRRLWLLGSVALRIVLGANPVWQVEIYWRRLVPALTVLALAAYLGLATAAWYWWARNPVSQVRWRDVALAPVRWDELTRRRGETAIATALERLKQKDYTEAYYGLRVGLARAPGNTAARLVLAQLLAFQNPVQALNLLEEGLQYTPNDRGLLQALFGLYAAQQAPDRALMQAEALMAPGRSPATNLETRFFAGTIRFSLFLETGRTAEAERAYGELEPLIATPADRLTWHRLRLSLLLKRGELSEARAWYKQAYPAGDSGAEGYRAAAEIALAAGDDEELSLALRRLQLASKNGVAANLYAYQCWHKAGQTARMAATERGFFSQYGGDDAALQAFAALAVNLELPDVVAHAAQVARANRLSDFAFKVHLTEIALRQGKFDAAFSQLSDWERSVETLKVEQRFYPQFLSRLVRCCVAGGDQQTGLLLHALGDGRGQAQMGVYRLAVEALERSGNPAAAAQVAQAGLVLYPYSAPLLAANERLSSRLAATQKPAGGSGSATPPVLPDTADATLLAIDQALGKGEYIQARDLLAETRRQSPAWLAGAEGELAIREVALALRTQEPLAVRAVASGYLERHRAEEDVLRLVKLATAEQARQHPTEARLLHDVVSVLPNASEAVRAALTAMKLSDDLAEIAAARATTLAAMDRSLAARQYAEADRLLRYLRERQPAWLVDAATDLAVREVPLRLAMDQQPAALEIFKSLVVRAGASRSAAFRLVRELLARGETQAAQQLARETVRLLPDEPAAAKLLQEAETPQRER